MVLEVGLIRQGLSVGGVGRLTNEGIVASRWDWKWDWSAASGAGWRWDGRL